MLPALEGVRVGIKRVGRLFLNKPTVLLKLHFSSSKRRKCYLLAENEKKRNKICSVGNSVILIL